MYNWCAGLYCYCYRWIGRILLENPWSSHKAYSLHSHVVVTQKLCPLLFIHRSRCFCSYINVTMLQPTEKLLTHMQSCVDDFWTNKSMPHMIRFCTKKEEFIALSLSFAWYSDISCIFIYYTFRDAGFDFLFHDLRCVSPPPTRLHHILQQTGASCPPEVLWVSTPCKTHRQMVVISHLKTTISLAFSFIFPKMFHVLFLHRHSIACVIEMICDYVLMDQYSRPMNACFSSSAPSL